MGLKFGKSLSLLAARELMATPPPVTDFLDEEGVEVPPYQKRVLRHIEARRESHFDRVMNLLFSRGAQKRTVVFTESPMTKRQRRRLRGKKKEWRIINGK